MSILSRFLTPHGRAQALVRQGLGSLGGVLLALLLFTLLALLVTPPEDDRPVIEMPMSISMVETEQRQAPTEAATPAEATPAPPAATPPPPPPAPMPAPSLDSAIAMPTPEIPPLDVSRMPLDSELPELTAIEPQPEPEPQPQPEPQPDPQPAPEPEPAQPSPNQSVAEASEQSSEAPAPTEATEVGSPQPTRRVPPEYPARAQRRGLEGYVEVRFTILPDGNVDAGSISVVDAQPRNVFEQAALQAISNWQFSEATGPREARQRLEFKLEG